MAYVYSHYTADTDEIFYIGISKTSDGKFLRALDKNKRSKFWKSIVAKHGFRFEIISDKITWDEAIKLEIELISKYGRINNNTGVLCNLTDGGEGCIGFAITEQYRENCRKAQAKRVKPNMRGENNPFFGKKHTKESMIKKSQTTKANGKLKGENNPNFGKPVSEERRENQRQFRLGKTHPEETKVKIRAWGKGRSKPLEWRESRKGKGNQNFIDFAPIEEIERLYVVERLSTTKIGKMFNVSAQTVYKRLIDAEIPTRNASDRAIAIQCVNDGKIYRTMGDAADFYNIQRSSIYCVLKGKFKKIKGLIFIKI